MCLYNKPSDVNYFTTLRNPYKMVLEGMVNDVRTHRGRFLQRGYGGIKNPVEPNFYYPVISRGFQPYSSPYSTLLPSLLPGGVRPAYYQRGGGFWSTIGNSIWSFIKNILPIGKSVVQSVAKNPSTKQMVKDAAVEVAKEAASAGSKALSSVIKGKKRDAKEEVKRGAKESGRILKSHLKKAATSAIASLISSAQDGDGSIKSSAPVFAKRSRKAAGEKKEEEEEGPPRKKAAAAVRSRSQSIPRYKTKTTAALKGTKNRRNKKKDRLVKIFGDESVFNE